MIRFYQDLKKIIIMDGKVILIILIIGVIIFITYKLWKKFKCINIGAFSLVTGGIKTGKSTFGLYLALRTYKKVHRRWYIRKFFGKNEEEPLLYSNIPLSVPYVPLTQDLLLRKKRFRFNSVVFLDEGSLVADSQLISNADINESLMLLVKLIGHELHGNGALIVNSQATQDLHYSFRRCVDRRYYVAHTFKWLPFFLLVTLREERYSEDGSVVTSYNEDLDESLKRVLIPKSIWKKFDRCAFSGFTDGLNVVDNLTCANDNFKVDKNNFVSFRRFKFLNKKDETKKDFVKSSFGFIKKNEVKEEKKEENNNA